MKIFKNLTKVLAMIAMVVMFVSCNKEDKEKDSTTKISVHLKDSDGTPLKGWVVYAYNEFWWGTQDYKSTVGVKQSATDSNGVAVFPLEEIDIDVTDKQEVYRFVVYYTSTKKNIFGETLSKTDLKKVATVNVNTGENKTVELKLD